MKKADTITAAGFLLFAAAMLVTALVHLPAIKDALYPGWVEASEAGAGLLDKAVYLTREGEAALTGQLDPRHLFIQLFGGAQRLMGRRYVADAVATSSVARLDDGSLNFVDLSAATGGAAPDVSGSAEAAAALSRQLAEEGIPFLLIAAPQKLSPSNGLPAGLTDYTNGAVDDLLARLDAAGVDALDLRPAFDGRADRSALFFRTDHHWRPEGAFYAWQQLAPELAARYGWEIDPAFTDAANYDWQSIPGLFLGSQGKRVGSLYAGADDFTVATPRFETDFSYATPYEVRTGPFEQSLCFPQFVAERDWFNINPYVYYSGGDYGEAVITNRLDPDGPSVLMIRDSFACALTPFMAPACSRLTTVDLRHLERPLREVIGEADPDLVLLLYCPGTCSIPSMFDFGLS